MSNYRPVDWLIVWFLIPEKKKKRRLTKSFDGLKNDVKSILCCSLPSLKLLHPFYRVLTKHFTSFIFFTHTFSQFQIWQRSPKVLSCVTSWKPCKWRSENNTRILRKTFSNGENCGFKRGHFFLFYFDTGILSLGHSVSLQPLAQRTKSCNVENVRNKLTLHSYRMREITFIIQV